MGRREQPPREEISATSSRNFRTFLLLQQIAAAEIGERIKEARREAGFTQDELADLLEVTTRTVQAWEAGDNIPYRSLSKLAEVLNREVGWFLHGDESEPTNEDRLRRIVQEVLEGVRETMARIEDLLHEEQPRRRRATS